MSLPLSRYSPVGRRLDVNAISFERLAKAWHGPLGMDRLTWAAWHGPLGVGGLFGVGRFSPIRPSTSKKRVAHGGKLRQTTMRVADDSADANHSNFIGSLGLAAMAYFRNNTVNLLNLHYGIH